MFAGTAVALFDIVLRMDGIGGFDEELENALDVRIGRTRVKVLRLARIIASKKAANRRKDRMILPVLQDTAATIRERGSKS